MGKKEVKETLAEAIGFLSGDHFDFRFRPLEGDIERQSYFNLDKESPWFQADSILLFSGGLDSLAGAIDELKNKNNDIILVSHRPMAKISSRQKNLVKELKRLFANERKILHIPVWQIKILG